MKVDKNALTVAAKKLRKLRLTQSYALMDDADPAETVKSVLKRGLQGLYSDSSVEYILEHGIKYYLKATNKEQAGGIS